jgi:hypothetical protein
LGLADGIADDDMKPGFAVEEGKHHVTGSDRVAGAPGERCLQHDPCYRLSE